MSAINDVRIYGYFQLNMTSLHSFDIICLSETYLDSSTLSHDPNLDVQGYELIRSPVKRQERWSLYLLQKPSSLETN